MRYITTLSQLSPGQHATVLGIYAHERMRCRLQYLGLIRGTEVVCVQKSPLGDPVAYLIRGAVIALRRQDAGCVQIQCSEV